jgi:spermidine/putrescine transport system ATP-binding protein
VGIYEKVGSRVVDGSPDGRGGSGTPSIELENVTKTFGEIVAVDNLSLSVAPGEFLALLGPSGCGKTTTLRMIGGFELPDAGSVRINGEEMGNRPPYRRQVNTVFQNYALFPHLSVGRNVGYGLEMARVPKDQRTGRVTNALAMVRLPDVEKRKPSELSGGQQQRVALARALVNRPQVLLLDEPLGALDLKLRKAMQLELKRLNREVGATFVYVTHDQEEALTMSNRIAVMNEGRILQVGSPDEIYERPRSRFVADFIGQTNFLSGSIVVVDGGLATIDVPGAGHVRGSVPAGMHPMGTVTMALRPERVFLEADLDGKVPTGWIRIRGVVTDVIYLGTHTQYLIAVGSKQSLLVHRQNRSAAAPGVGQGETATIVFDPASASVLND